MDKTLFTHYEEFYDKAGIIPQQTDKEEVRFFADLVPHDKKIKILDLGCAEGELAIELALRGHDVTAADISQGYLNQCIKKAQENSVKLNVVRCDIENDISQFKGTKFDIIFFLDVIEHLRSPISGLTNIRKLLSNDGILFLHTPNICSFSHFLYLIRQRNKLINYYDPKNCWDTHLQMYDYTTLEKLLNFVGLKVYEVLPTKLSLPILSRFKFFNSLSKFLAKKFPFLQDTLLLKIKKEKPIDMDKQILFWSKSR